MRTMVKENAAEALLGLLVVVIAIGFVALAWQRTGGGNRADALHVTAIFPSAGGVNMGTEVRVAGIKVGAVSSLKLDPQSFEAQVILALDPKIKVPSDSSAAVTSEGLLGSTYIGLNPGGAPTPLKDGDTIVDTQGSMDLMGLIGQFINKSGAGKPSESSTMGNGADAPADARP